MLLQTYKKLHEQDASLVKSQASNGVASNGKSTGDASNDKSVTRASRQKKRHAANGSETHEAEKWSMVASRPTLRFCDLGGMDACIQDIRELIEYPLTHPEIYVHLGVEPPRGILLYGPPGCGKTTLANAIAGVSQHKNHE
jgi:ribosome biogenesis ATPase